VVLPYPISRSSTAPASSMTAMTPFVVKKAAFTRERSSAFTILFSYHNSAAATATPTNHSAPAPGVIVFPECEGIVLHAGPTQSGGASAEWFAKLLGRSPAGLTELAASADVSRPLPVFLPHLDGERAPLWDITARASFAGLSSVMGAAELARAVLEGVGYSARLLLERLEASACCRPDVIHHSGGGSASDLWCQIRADILGRPLHRTAVRDAGVLGAALMAGTGAGLFTSLHDAARTFVKIDRTFEPNRAERERHERGFAAYQLLYKQLIPVNAAMN